jgi:hypothetical protein
VTINKDRLLPRSPADPCNKVERTQTPKLEVTAKIKMLDALVSEQLAR